jgi:predicted RNA-binding protein with PIN domain
MSFLIDGYNLLFTMGVQRSQLGPTGLEKARLRLLGLLRGAYGDEASTVTVVFDAAGARPGATEVSDYRGIHVHFAVHQQEADDLIEAIIRRDSAPRHLTVVSDDHRIQQAARRRHCTVLGCAAYLDWLEQHRRKQPSVPDSTSKPDSISAEEAEHWLREFADLEHDPGLKELSDPPEFFADDS